MWEISVGALQIVHIPRPDKEKETVFPQEWSSRQVAVRIFPDYTIKIRDLT